MLEYPLPACEYTLAVYSQGVSLAYQAWSQQHPCPCDTACFLISLRHYFCTSVVQVAVAQQEVHLLE